MKFKLVEEVINTACNTNALFLLLYEKGIINSREFNSAKDQCLKEIKSEFPELFK